MVLSVPDVSFGPVLTDVHIRPERGDKGRVLRQREGLRFVFV